MTNRFQNKNNGFSLLEVILYVAILSSLVFGIGAVVNLISVSQVKSQNMIEVDAQAIQIIQNISQVIRNSNNVISPTIGQNQDSLTVTDINNNVIVLALDGGKFTINKGVGSVNLNNEKVYIKDLLFKNLSRAGTPDIIQIIFTIGNNFDSENQNNNYSKTYVASAHLSK